MRKEYIKILIYLLIFTLAFPVANAVISIPAIPAKYSLIKEVTSGPWNVRVFPQINTAGIHLALTGSASGSDSSFSSVKTEVSYKESSSTIWIKAHSLTGKINENYDLYITSLFYLKPDTSYDLLLVLKTGTATTIRQITLTFRTQQDQFSFQPIKTLIVDKSNNGDFTTIQSAIDSVQTVPGTRIIVKPGIYYETIKHKTPFNL